MERNLTFETLPKAVAQLWDKLDNIERLLSEKESTKFINQTEQLLTVQEAANFLGLAKATIYSKVSKRELPFMKRGKMLYFSQADLLEYIRDGHKQTTNEIKSEVHNYLKKGGENA